MFTEKMFTFSRYDVCLILAIITETVTEIYAYLIRDPLRFRYSILNGSSIKAGMRALEKASQNQPVL